MNDQPELGRITFKMDPDVDFEHADTVHFTVTMAVPPDDWTGWGAPS